MARLPHTLRGRRKKRRRRAAKRRFYDYLSAALERLGRYLNTIFGLSADRVRAAWRKEL